MKDRILLSLATMTTRNALLISFVLAVGYFIFFYTGTSADEARIQVLKQEIKVEEMKLKDIHLANQQLRGEKEGTADLQKQKTKLEEAFSISLSIRDVIRAVDGAVQASGVSIKSKEPQQPSQREGFMTYPLHLTLEGSYANLSLFIYQLSRFKTPIGVGNFSLQSQNSPGGLGGGKSNHLSLVGEVAGFSMSAVVNPTASPSLTVGRL